MKTKKKNVKTPFFELGPKAYMYGDDLLKLAKEADRLSEKYDVRIILTPQAADLRLLAEQTEHVLIFAQHMDPLQIGRGLGSELPEALKAAGAVGVMLNHAEKPLTLHELALSMQRADELGLITIVCADSLLEAKAIAELHPDILVAEPTELIGTGKIADEEYVRTVIEEIKAIDPDITVLPAAGIKNGEDVYQMIRAGADCTGSSSGVFQAENPAAMLEEMISAVRRAYDERVNR